MTQNKSNGFTLLELLITLSIASMIFLFCHHLHDVFPSLSNECDAHRFLNNLSFARSAAIKGNRLVTVCPTIDQEHCNDDWSSGYMVFYPPKDKNQSIIVLRYEKNNSHTHIRSRSTSLIQFSGDGRSLHRATFYLDTKKPYEVVVYDSGRIRLSCHS